MKRLKLFREVNNLTQSELGRYTGHHKAFLSSIEHGRNKIPYKMLNMILNNPYGWDVSMLSSQSESGSTLPVQNDVLVAELRAQIERLESKVDQLNQELGEKNALLKMMRQGGEESVTDADYSLSASVV